MTSVLSNMKVTDTLKKKKKKGSFKIVGMWKCGVLMIRKHSWFKKVWKARNCH